jgi:predicted alpha-1,6-mannanase (GH76 family)
MTTHEHRCLGALAACTAFATVCVACGGRAPTGAAAGPPEASTDAVSSSGAGGEADAAEAGAMNDAPSRVETGALPGGEPNDATTTGETGATGDATDSADADDARGFADAPADATPTAPPVFDDQLRVRAQLGMVPLATWYDATTGLWNMTDWWTSANQLETTIDYSRETGDPTYAGEIDNTFAINSPSNFDRFGYYDDDGWWALAWIKAYDLSHQQKYLDMAKTIFQRMSGAWDGKCGGGIYWAGAKAGANAFKNKNAIPNSLFLRVAASLHLRTPGDAGPGSYLDWAEREWAWFKGTGMLTAKNQVVDTLADLTSCAPTGPIFTYNQGVLLGGLVDLAASTGDATLLAQASAIAHATMTLMADAKGILVEAPCGGDICVQFKGVYMRNLAHLYRAQPLPEYRTYMRLQSDNLWNVERTAQNEFGYPWDQPFDKATASRQSSALDALVAAVVSSNMNLALGATATGSSPCSAAEPPAYAIDGSSRWDSKWCSAGPGNQWLAVDLGAVRSIVGFRLRHAGAGGESSTWDTRDFEIATSIDGQAWTAAVAVVGNTADVSTHPVAPVGARYVRLHVTTAAQPGAGAPAAARIYELEVLGATL